MQYALFFTIFSLLFFAPHNTSAQKKRFNPKQRFHAGVILGLNLSQLDGDKFTGYDKPGIMGGLQGIAVVNRRLELVAELLYSQKGTRVEYMDVAHPKKERLLGLNYAEAPILLRINLAPNVKEGYKPIELETGFSIARLVQTNIEEEVNRVKYSFTEVADDFARTEINFIIGMHLSLFPNFNLGIRTNTALTRLYDNKDFEPLTRIDAQFGISQPYKFFRNYHLSLYASYQIY